MNLKNVHTNAMFYPTVCINHIGEGNGNPLQCSCLENPRDRGASWAVVSGVAQSRTRLKRLSSSSIHKLKAGIFIFTHIFHNCLLKEKFTFTHRIFCFEIVTARVNKVCPIRGSTCPYPGGSRVKGASGEVTKQTRFVSSLPLSGNEVPSHLTLC